MYADSLHMTDDLAAFADGAIGGGLSPEVLALMGRAGALRAQPEAALALLEQARAAAPRHPAPLIALYRFYFYGHQLEQALAVGEDALAIARTALEPVHGLYGVTQVVFREGLQGAKRSRARARQGFATPQAPRKTTCPLGWAEIRRLAHQTPCMGTQPMRRGVGRPLIPIAAQRDPVEIVNRLLGPNFGDEPPTDAAARHDAAVRFYLFTLKGLAYLNMRLGALDEAAVLLKELRRLDPGDHVGGAVLQHVLTRHEKGETADAPANYPARGWGAVAP